VRGRLCGHSAGPAGPADGNVAFTWLHKQQYELSFNAGYMINTENAATATFPATSSIWTGPWPIMPMPPWRLARWAPSSRRRRRIRAKAPAWVDFFLGCGSRPGRRRHVAGLRQGPHVRGQMAAWRKRCAQFPGRNGLCFPDREFL